MHPAPNRTCPTLTAIPDPVTVITNPALAACWLEESTPEELTSFVVSARQFSPNRTLGTFLARVQTRLEEPLRVAPI